MNEYIRRKIEVGKVKQIPERVVSTGLLALKAAVILGQDT